MLGAGVMGAQIAAHLVNADVETLLFDLPAKEGGKNAIVLKAIQNLAKLSPSPLAEKNRAAAITAANYDEDLDALRGCDLIIEAIAERLDWKLDLYRKIAPYVSDSTVIASNTSGLSINALAEALPSSLRPRFSGIHFFNPPRYMHLVELIPDRETDRTILAGLEAFLTTTLGKGVVYAKDTPNFIGNRIGVFSILATMHHTAALGLGFDLVDALTGPAIGRPKSATYRTADVVGLDTMAHVIQTMADTLPKDPWHRYFKAPDWLAALIAQGALGQKTGAGVYRKVGKGHPRARSGETRLPGVRTGNQRRSRIDSRDQGPGGEVRAPACVQGIRRRAFSGQCFATSSTTPRSISPTSPRPRAMSISPSAGGYGWKLGPFETWQAAGWQPVAQWIAEDIAAGNAMSDAPLPAWVTDGRRGVHDATGSFAPKSGKDEPRSSHPSIDASSFQIR